MQENLNGLTLPLGGQVITPCPVVRPYQFGPVRNPPM